MESRPDLVPPCCAACWKAGVASVTWHDDDGPPPGGEWWAHHSDVHVKLAYGAEALAVLQELHYAQSAAKTIRATTQSMSIEEATRDSEVKHG